MGSQTTLLFLKAHGDHLTRQHYDTAGSKFVTYRTQLFTTETTEITRGTKEKSECSNRASASRIQVCVPASVVTLAMHVMCRPQSSRHGGKGRFHRFMGSRGRFIVRITHITLQDVLLFR